MVSTPQASGRAGVEAFEPEDARGIDERVAGMLLPILVRRQSRRAVSSDPVPDGAVTALLEAARLAPSFGNRQPWRFVAVSEPGTLERLRGGISRPTNEWALAAPLMIAVCGRPEDDVVRGGLTYYLFDCGLAVADLLLQAMHLGLLAHPFGGFDEAAVGAALELPEPYRVVCLVALGHSGSLESLDAEALAKERRPRERRPLTEIACRDRWGVAWRLDDTRDAGGARPER